MTIKNIRATTTDSDNTSRSINAICSTELPIKKPFKKVLLVNKKEKAILKRRLAKKSNKPNPISLLPKPIKEFNKRKKDKKIFNNKTPISLELLCFFLIINTQFKRY